MLRARQIELSLYRPVRFLSTTFPDWGAKPQKHRPYFSEPQDAHCPNKHRVSRPKVFSPVNPRVPELDDGWLPWWCECSPCTMTTLRNSEVFQLNFLWFTNQMIFGDVKVRCNALCQLQWGLALGWGNARFGNLPIYYLILGNKMSNAINKIYIYIFI